MTEPVVSIIGTVYNQAKAAERTIDIWCRQNFSLPYELIILDDGSTDNIKEVVESFSRAYPERIRYYYFDTPGFTRNCTLLFNTAIRRLMRSEIAVIQWYDRIPGSFNCLSELYFPLLSDPNQSVTFLTRHIAGSSSREVFDEAEVDALLDSVDWRKDPSELQKIMGTPGSHCFPNTMNESACFSVLRKHLLDINGYDERYFKVANYSNVELYGRLKSHGLKMNILENEFTFHQPHPANREDIQTPIEPDTVVVRNRIIRQNWGSIVPDEMVKADEFSFSIVCRNQDEQKQYSKLLNTEAGVELLLEPDYSAALSKSSGKILIFPGDNPNAIIPEYLEQIGKLFELQERLGSVAPHGGQIRSKDGELFVEASKKQAMLVWGFPFALNRRRAAANGISFESELGEELGFLDLSRQMTIWGGAQNISLEIAAPHDIQFSRLFKERWSFL